MGLIKAQHVIIIKKEAIILLLRLRRRLNNLFIFNRFSDLFVLENKHLTTIYRYQLFTTYDQIYFSAYWLVNFNKCYVSLKWFYA